MQWNDFLAIKASQRVVVLDPVCLEMLNNDHLTALMLSQILYWYTPNDKGQTRLGVFKNGHEWLVKKRTDWINEPCRLSEKQARRSLEILKENKLIITEIHRFNCFPTTHIRLNIEVFLTTYFECASRLFLPSRAKTDVGLRGQNINRDYLTEIYKVEGIKGEVTDTSLPKNHENSTTFIPVGDSEGEAVTGGVKGAQMSKRLLTLKMVRHFTKCYERVRGVDHPILSKANRDKACTQLDKWFSGDTDLFERAVDGYFNTEFKDCDYRIMHFVQDGILENRIFEAIQAWAESMYLAQTA